MTKKHALKYILDIIILNAGATPMCGWVKERRGISSLVDCRTVLTMLLLLLSAILAVGCGTRAVSRHLLTPAQVLGTQHDSGSLKAHMKGGDLYVFSDWRLDSFPVQVFGRGIHLDWNRELIDSGDYIVPLDSVVIFETNEAHMSASVAALCIVTVASAVMTIVCLANPKACFGSCPTFYVDDGDSLLLQAEGFSSSVSPALEATDIDALYQASFRGPSTTITMTNEAYETHVVRYADLLAVEKPESGRVMANSDQEFWEVLEVAAPLSLIDNQNGGGSPLTAVDGREWFSLADSVDLTTKEVLELQFPLITAEKFGIAIASRQSLMSTYLFYQTLAYMGTGAGEFFASLERHGRSAINEFQAFGEELGSIEVLIPDSLGNWRVAGVIRETGPLATDVHLMLLPEIKNSPTNVRLRLTKGYWRIDQVALVAVGKQLTPRRIHPSKAAFQGKNDPAALASLLDSSKTLITLPGDTIRLVYLLPQMPNDYEYFLETRGYYLEWMRENWLTQEDRQLASLMLFDPRSALKSLAPEYKRVEAQMEQFFWNSRYAN